MTMIILVKPADLDFKLGEKKRISVKNKASLQDNMSV